MNSIIETILLVWLLACAPTPVLEGVIAAIKTQPPQPAAAVIFDIQNELRERPLRGMRCSEGAPSQSP